MDNFQRLEADRKMMDILRELARRPDPVPAAVAAGAVAALSERTVDKDLAALVSDSLLDGEPAPDGVRRLTFVGKTIGLELDVADDGLRGRLFPPTPADLEVRWPGGGVAAVADDRGGFSVPAVPTGPVSLRCRGRSATRRRLVVTDWVTL